MAIVDAAPSPTGGDKPQGTANTGKNRWLVLGVLELVLVVALTRVVVPRFIPDSRLDIFDTVSSVGAVTVGLYTALLPDQIRSHVVAQLQKLIGRPVTTIVLTILLVTLLLASCILQYTFKWVGPQSLSIKLNGSIETLNSAQTIDGFQIDRRLRLAFVPFKVNAPAFSQWYEPQPLDISPEVTIPPFVTEEGDDKYLPATSALFSSLFQLSPADYLRQVATVTTQLGNTPGDKFRQTRFLDLDRLLTTIFVNMDAGVAKAQLQNFIDQDKGDPWNSLLTAAYDNLTKHYDRCVHDLDDDYVHKMTSYGFRKLAAAALFFRGQCYLKAGSAAIDVNNSKSNLAAAQQSFEQSAALVRQTQTEDDGFPKFAVGNAILFQGISRMYAADLGGAKQEFGQVSDLISDGETDSSLTLVRARALDAEGFVDFVTNDVATAKDKLRAALKAYPNFSFANANLGFLLMTSSANSAEALSDLQSAYNEASDANADKKNPDVASLSQLAMAHWKEIDSPNDLGGAVDGYVRLARGLNADTADWANSPQLDSLRYAIVARELSAKIYLGGTYYGDDFLALAYLCHAKQRLRGVLPSQVPPQHQNEVELLRADFVVSTKSLLTRVTSASTSYPHEGWYSSIVGCAN